MATVQIQGRKLEGTPAGRAVKAPTPSGFKGSVYRVEVREAPPRFSRGDERDDGRNILSAVLIGMSWTTVGYVVGHKGDWFAYSKDPFNTYAKKSLPNGRTRRSKVYVPPLTGGRQRTVREAAWVVISSQFGYGS
jgi:hypothetical protein